MVVDSLGRWTKGRAGQSSGVRPQGGRPIVARPGLTLGRNNLGTSSVLTEGRVERLGDVQPGRALDVTPNLVRDLLLSRNGVAIIGTGAVLKRKSALQLVISGHAGLATIVHRTPLEQDAAGATILAEGMTLRARGHTEEFGIYYPWKTDEQLNLSQALTGTLQPVLRETNAENISRQVAEAEGLARSSPRPVMVVLRLPESQKEKIPEFSRLLQGLVESRAKSGLVGFEIIVQKSFFDTEGKSEAFWVNPKYCDWLRQQSWPPTDYNSWLTSVGTTTRMADSSLVVAQRKPEVPAARSIAPASPLLPSTPARAVAPASNTSQPAEKIPDAPRNAGISVVPKFSGVGAAIIRLLSHPGALIINVTTDGIPESRSFQDTSFILGRDRDSQGIIATFLGTAEVTLVRQGRREILRADTDRVVRPGDRFELGHPKNRLDIPNFAEDAYYCHEYGPITRETLPAIIAAVGKTVGRYDEVARTGTQVALAYQPQGQSPALPRIVEMVVGRSEGRAAKAANLLGTLADSILRTTSVGAVWIHSDLAEGDPVEFWKFR